MTIHPYQTSFNGGEQSPLMIGRFDLEQFRGACREVKNFIVRAHGPAVRRGGMRFVSESGDHGHRSRLILFEYGIEQSYVLEFGHCYIRVYADGARVMTLSAGGVPVPVRISTPYTEEQLRSLRTVQSADVMYIFHKDHAPRKLQRLTLDGTMWQLSTVAFLPGPTHEPEIDLSGGSITVGLSAASGPDVTIRSSASLFLNADDGRLFKSGAGSASITAYVNANEVTADILSEFAGMISMGPGTLSASGIAVTFTGNHGLSVGDFVVLTNGSQAGQIRCVTAVGSVSTCTIDAAFTANQAAGTTWNKSLPIAAGEWLLTGSPNADCTPNIKAPVNAIVTLTLNRAGWRVSDVGKYVRMFSGIVKITQFISVTQVRGRILQRLTVDPIVAAAAGSWLCETDTWTDANGYPRAGCFFEQRLIVGGSTKFPTTLWGSQSGDFENFGLGSLGSDGLEYRLAADKINDLMWMSPTKVLLLGTAGGEFRITGGADSPLTPYNVDVKNEDSVGSADVSPVRIRYKVVFVQRSGRKVLEMAYSYDADTYFASDMTELAEHMTESGIVELVFQKEPEGVLWCVRSDGLLIGCTRSHEQKVAAWHQHLTAGTVESICTVPDPENGRNLLYLLVRRNVGGKDRRFIEYIDQDRPNADSFVLYQGEPTTTIEGLDHIEGEGVVVVADGFVVQGKTVLDGQVALDHPASEVVVGLPYTSRLVPNRPEFTDGQFSSIGKRKRWVKAFLRLYQTSGVTVNGEEIAWRSGSDPLGAAPALLTGDRLVSVRGIDREGDIIVEQNRPLPATIICVGGTLEVED